MYVDILCRLRDAVRRETPYKMENQQLLLSSRRSCSTPVGFGHWVLSKEHIDNTGTAPPPNSPDLVPPAYYPLPRMKPALKGRRFCDATGVIMNAKEELERI